MAPLRHIGGVLRELGETDCEFLGDGWLAQPVNALSSLAYVLIGMAIAVAAARSTRVHNGSLVYAGCLVAVGLGSVAFHGPQINGSQTMHDLPILLTVLFMLNHDRLVLRPDSSRELVTFAGVALVALMLADAGCAVALAARSGDELDSLVDEIEKGLARPPVSPSRAVSCTMSQASWAAASLNRSGLRTRLTLGSACHCSSGSRMRVRALPSLSRVNFPRGLFSSAYQIVSMMIPFRFNQSFR